MDVRNCKNCGKIFNYLSGDIICPTCYKKLDEKFREVKEYIYKNPGAGVNEVATENDISVSQIKKWVREERLEFTEDALVGIECESCGVSIRTGRFCQNCKNVLAQQFESLYNKKVNQNDKKINYKDNPRMRFLND